MLDPGHNSKQARLEAERIRPIALRCSVFSLLPQFFVALFLSFILYRWSVWELTANQSGTVPVFLRLFAMVPALFILNLVRQYFNNRYILGRQRLRLYKGLLSFSLERPAIDYSDIREIQVSQGVLGRVFKFGNLAVGTAGTDNIQDVLLKNIPAPYKVQAILDERRKIRHEKLQITTHSGAE